MRPQAPCPQTPRNLTSLGAEAASAQQAGETTSCSTPLTLCMPSPAQWLEERRNPFSVLIHPSPNRIGNGRCRRPPPVPHACALHTFTPPRWIDGASPSCWAAVCSWPTPGSMHPRVCASCPAPPCLATTVIATYTHLHRNPATPLHCSCLTRMMPSNRSLLAYEDEWPASFFSQPANPTHSQPILSRALCPLSPPATSV